MTYPKLENTPIKEIVFSISYEEIVDKDCFDKFVGLDFIKETFKDIKPSVVLELTNQGIKQSTSNTGYHLKNEDQVLQLRTGSFSYHFLNSYCDYDKILEKLIGFWKMFDEVTKDMLTITSISVRYINVIEIDDENPESRLVQLYPKQSSDRNIINFQNSVHFTYKESPEYMVTVVSTKPKQDLVLLDISVNHKIIDKKDNNLKELFKPLQEIKNKVFFDSITAKALIRYINQNK